MFKKLNKNSVIGLVSPAWVPKEDRLEAGIKYLESKGMQVKQGINLDKTFGYFAGTDDERIADLLKMYADPQVDMIMCSRGGWGGLRLLDRLDFDIIKNNPKPLVGYSDITTLQLAIWAKTGIPSFSGPMVGVEMGKGIHGFTEKNFWNQIFNDKSEYELELSDTTSQVMVQGQAEGTLLGGCLSLVSHLLGTPYSPDYEDSILFLEDVGEQPYKIDRYLAHLKQAGIFDKINGLILGEFIDCEDEDKRSFTIADILNDYFSEASFPVIYNFPYGHGDIKFSMPIGVTTFLDTNRNRFRVTNPFQVD